MDISARRRRPRKGTVLISSAVVLAASFTAVPASAGGKPDLVVAFLSKPPATKMGGKSFSVTTKVKNVGGAHAGPSTLRFYLSFDGKRGQDFRLAGSRTVPSLAAGVTSRGQSSVTIPRKIVGPFHVLACADDRKALAESDESNNCLATQNTVWVTKGGKGTWPNLTPTPRQVTPHEATGAAVSKTIKAVKGGTIVAARGGSSFTLTVPAGALVSDERITMTPLSGVGGMPFAAGMGAGVALEPDGLRFMKSVRLTIVPAAPIPLKRQTATISKGDGSDFHLYPLDDVKAIRLSLMHFTDAEVSEATPTEEASQQHRVPFMTEARWEQFLKKVGDAVGSVRRDELVGRDGEETAWTDMFAIQRGYFYQVLLPKLKEALSSEDSAVSLGPDIISKLIAWVNTLTHQDMLDAFQNELEKTNALAKDLLPMIYNGAYKRCTVDHEYGRGLLMLPTFFLAKQLGIENDEGSSPLDADKIDKCLRFKLDFDSVFTTPAYTYGDSDHGGQYTSYQLHVKALDVPARFESVNVNHSGKSTLEFRLTGEGPSQYPTYTGSGKYWDKVYKDGNPFLCKGTEKAAGTQGGTFYVRGGGFDVNLFQKAKRVTLSPRPDLRLLIDPGLPGDDWAPVDVTTYTSNWDHCTYPVGNVPNWFWAASYLVVHFDELAHPGEGKGPYEVRKWTPGTGATALTKTYDRDIPQQDVTSHELTTLTLRHTPA